MAILYHTRNKAAPLQHLCSPDILIQSGDMVDDLDFIEED